MACRSLLLASAFCGLLLIGTIALVDAKPELDRWGKDVAWFDNYEEGFKKAEESDKPVFIVIWRSWCEASKGFADRVSKSKDFVRLSKKFVMVNVWTEDEEPWFEEFEAKPEATPHVPRIHFSTPSRKLITDVKCDDPSKDENFTFYYHKVQTLLDGMEDALLKYKKMPKPEKKEDDEADKKKEAKDKKEESKDKKKVDKADDKEEKKDKKTKKPKKDEKESKTKDEKKPKDEKKKKKKKKTEL